MQVRALRLTAATSALAVALISGAVACSSDTATPDKVAATTSAASSGAGTSPVEKGGDHESFTQCMTDHGVPAPPEGGPGGSRPPGGPGAPGGAPPAGPPPSGAPGEHGTPPAPPGVDQNTWDQAMQACQSLAPMPPHPGQ